MMIYETIVTTQNSDGSVHLAPMGVHTADDDLIDGLILAPFKPSATLDNLLRERIAVVNYVADSRVFAACLTGRNPDWELAATEKINGKRLALALAHAEVELNQISDDELRPRLHCKVVNEVTHRPFRGFNRAQAAIIELAILVSRLDRLPDEKIDNELAYLQIAIDKTAGDAEKTAWQWLNETINTYRSNRL